MRLTPQQNGLVKRINKTLMEIVRCMLIQSKLPKSLWAEILMTTTYLVNLSPLSVIEFKTPFKVGWGGGEPTSHGNLKVFGCFHVRQGKLAPKALKGVFIGYLEGVEVY